uniref:Putative ovule protein n=1 Tax=Solanum chacoense TaxID=4108 RepID=A0A0V0HW67_SOLCH
METEQVLESMARIDNVVLPTKARLDGLTKCCSWDLNMESPSCYSHALATRPSPREPILCY